MRSGKSYDILKIEWIAVKMKILKLRRKNSCFMREKEDKR